MVEKVTALALTRLYTIGTDDERSFTSAKRVARWNMPSTWGESTQGMVQPQVKLNSYVVGSHCFVARLVEQLLHSIALRDGFFLGANAKQPTFLLHLFACDPLRMHHRKYMDEKTK